MRNCESPFGRRSIMGLALTRCPGSINQGTIPPEGDTILPTHGQATCHLALPRRRRCGRRLPDGASAPERLCGRPREAPDRRRHRRHGLRSAIRHVRGSPTEHAIRHRHGWSLPGSPDRRARDTAPGAITAGPHRAVSVRNTPPTACLRAGHRRAARRRGLLRLQSARVRAVAVVQLRTGCFRVDHAGCGPDREPRRARPRSPRVRGHTTATPERAGHDVARRLRLRVGGRARRRPARRMRPDGPVSRLPWRASDRRSRRHRARGGNPRYRHPSHRRPPVMAASTASRGFDGGEDQYLRK